MSRPRLHDSLIDLFEARTPERLTACLQHPMLRSFLQTHELAMPLEALAIALTHTSFAHEQAVSHQETLEFLGDSVLQLIVTEELFRRYPKEKEGKLSKLRSSIVNEKSLARLARGLGLDELLLVGKGEFKKGLHRQDSTLADTFEAVLCQSYRFNGYDQTRSRCLSWIGTHAPELFELKVLDDFDAKSKLQEAALAKFKVLPKYISQEAPGGFRVSVWLMERLLAEGTFPSKKTGERELAQEILKKKLV